MLKLTSGSVQTTHESLVANTVAHSNDTMPKHELKYNVTDP